MFDKINLIKNSFKYEDFSQISFLWSGITEEELFDIRIFIKSLPKEKIEQARQKIALVNEHIADTVYKMSLDTQTTEKETLNMSGIQNTKDFQAMLEAFMSTLQPKTETPEKEVVVEKEICQKKPKEKFNVNDLVDLAQTSSLEDIKALLELITNEEIVKQFSPLVPSIVKAASLYLNPIVKSFAENIVANMYVDCESDRIKIIKSKAKLIKELSLELDSLVIDKELQKELLKIYFLSINKQMDFSGLNNLKK